MKNKPLLVLFNLTMALCGVHIAGAQTTAFTYQGKLVDDCCPATGLYDMVFRLYGVSSEGTALATLPVMTAVPVTNGLFTASLDFGSAPFDGSRLWLQLEVRTNNPAASFIPLTPRTELTPTPFAIRALSASSMSSNSITAPNISAGQVVKSLNGLKDNVTLSAGTNVTLTTNGNSIQISALGGGGSGLWSANGASAYYNGGNVGIGTGTPSAPLHVSANRVGGIANGNQSVLLVTNTATGSGFNFGLIAGGKTAIGAFSATGKSAYLANNTHAGQFYGDLSVEGNVGIGTTRPESLLELDGGNIHIRGGGGRLYFEGGPRDPNYFVGTYSTETAAGVRVMGYDGVKLSTGYGDILNVRGNSVGIGTGSPQTPLHIYSAENPATLRLQSSQGFGSARLEFWSDPQGSPYEWRPGLIQSEDAGNFTGQLVFYVNGTGYGNRTATSEALRLSNSGATVKALTITGGADLAEPFQMSEEKIPEGSVVVIDEENAGHLKQAIRAYDTRVAGIVSGANGVKAGIALQQEGVLEGGQNVALTGRVYVKADASFGAIKPGDLLTTSDTPGHAMKAVDHDRAKGAILGKAMSALTEGQGLVLVLVSLQ